MPDIWSFCESCERWFYRPSGEALDDMVACPVCAEPSRRRVDRVAAGAFEREPVV